MYSSYAAKVTGAGEWAKQFRLDPKGERKAKPYLLLRVIQIISNNCSCHITNARLDALSIHTCCPTVSSSRYANSTFFHFEYISLQAGTRSSRTHLFRVAVKGIKGMKNAGNRSPFFVFKALTDAPHQGQALSHTFRKTISEKTEPLFAFRLFGFAFRPGP